MRLWSAQLSVLLPWLETLRHDIVGANISEVRRRLRRSGGANADPFELEFKDLFWLFSRDRTDGHLRRTIRRLRDARNDLAHRKHLSRRYRPGLGPATAKLIQLAFKRHLPLMPRALWRLLAKGTGPRLSRGALLTSSEGAGASAPYTFRWRSLFSAR